MKLKKGSLADFANRVRERGKRIVVYGAGVIGQAAAPYWLREYGLTDSVLCYVDADPYKQGNTVSLHDRQVPVRSPAVLQEINGDCILLVTASAFEPILRALEPLAALRNTEAYFLPVMLLDIAHTPKRGGVVKTGETPVIPKKIHYCWFSGNPIPEPLQSCIASWRKFCPEYEIIRWDESNYDVSKRPYMQQAYARRKWGYIPDYARLDILYRHGGIYLDTDVELLRGLDDLLYQPAFCSTEKWGIVNMGICGAQPGNPALRAVLDHREHLTFLHPDGTENLISSGAYDTLPLTGLGLRPNGETQTLSGGMITVYAPEFFQPFDYMSGETHITQNTFSIHHFSGTWLGPEAAAERAKTQRQFQSFRARLQA